MKRSGRLVCVLSLATMLSSASLSQADVAVTVDPNQTWLGFMNVFDLPVGSGGYVFGSPWGTGDLAAAFNGPNLRLSPNTNTYNASDPFWVQPNGAGNKWMNANMYVENPALVGQTIVFSGQTLLNNFAPGYTSRAFIKVLDPAQGFATILETYAPLVSGQNFSLSLAVPNTAGLLPQYGFVTDGANANPATVDALGGAIVGPIPEPSSLLLASLAGIVFLRRR